MSWFLTGPTASGKTEAGIELALRLGGEIVSMDSMALYRKMDIGTAKPTPSQRAAVPHHLIDVLEPWQEFSLAQYVAAAERAAREIEARGRPAVFVGGTPLYLKALRRGIFQGPPADWELRRRLQAEAAEHGSEALWRRLRDVDPETASKIPPGDLRRIVRALEVHEKTGTPISRWQQQWQRPRRNHDPCLSPVSTASGLPAAAAGSPSGAAFWLDLPRAKLYARIDARVEAMFERGLVEEVRRLISSIAGRSAPVATSSAADHPYLPRRERSESTADPPDQAASAGLSRTARQALGYKEVIEHLQGVRTLDETVALVQRRTRQFAKRQLTWFRSLSELRRACLSGDESPRDIAAVLIRMRGE